MTTALFAFDQPAAAHIAAELLQHRGLPRSALQLHLPNTSPRDQAAAAIDEQTTGGLVTNVVGLFGQMFEWGSYPVDTSPFAGAVRRGGAVLSVLVRDDAERSTAEQVMASASPSARSGWFERPGS